MLITMSINFPDLSESHKSNVYFITTFVLQLKNNDVNTLPRLHNKYSKFAFSHSGSSTWNALPEELRAVDTTADFRRQ